MTHTHPLKILIAEDDRVSALYICKLLENSGHQTRLAKNGDVAFRILENEFFDLVLMDIQMPGVDGLEATHKIRNSAGALSTIPVIGVSANSDPPASEFCRDAGMNHFIPKPFSMPLFEQALWQIRNESVFG